MVYMQCDYDEHRMDHITSPLSAKARSTLQVVYTLVAAVIHLNGKAFSANILKLTFTSEPHLRAPDKASLERLPWPRFRAYPWAPLTAHRQLPWWEIMMEGPEGLPWPPLEWMGGNGAGP